MSPRTARKSGAERREQIALAALQILGESGLSGLSTSALAQAVDLTTGALFRHFASQGEILDEAVRRAVSQIEATFPDRALPAMDRLGRLARARIKLLSEEPGIAWLLRSGQSLSALPPDGAKHLGGLVRRSRKYIRDALKEAIESGSVRRDIPIDVLMLVFTATVHALVGSPGLQGKRTRPTPVSQSVDGLLTMLASREPRTTRK